MNNITTNTITNNNTTQNNQQTVQRKRKRTDEDTQPSKRQKIFFDELKNPLNGPCHTQDPKGLEHYYFTCKNGIPEGFARKVTFWGTLYFNYVNGVKSGRGSMISKDKSVRVNFMFVNNLAQGNAEEITSKGTMHFKYVNGIREGNMDFKGKDGTNLYATYNKGVLQGKAKEVNQKGTMRFNFSNGLREGPMSFQSKDKLRDASATYIQGKFQGEVKVIDKNQGTEIFNVVNGNKEGPGFSIRPGGKTETFYYQNNILNGPAQIVTPSLTKKFTYVNGVKQGPALFESTNGQIVRGTYVNNELEGSAVIILPNLNTIHCTFVKNTPHGNALEIDGLGNRLEFEYVNGVMQVNATAYEAATGKITPIFMKTSAELNTNSSNSSLPNNDQFVNLIKDPVDELSSIAEPGTDNTLQLDTDSMDEFFV